ncbi:Ig-like domain-containing protein [Luteolibacter sp. GHJ8]|uniref:Ig-like domain-containing protein n=1 Tax=Luteolibacter rhizosphaerae TaxID=2989719 RepID=A0ABT3G0L7_9BACT|nr:Ig-like domain-containing protein [Luteolibacter rhizosphaerae]MCW1913368.1 Ig-like domain-containing protein [Luteolibacter rhizosphaerae]
MNRTRLFSRAAALLALAASFLSPAVADQLPFTANQVAQLAYNQGFRGGSLMTAVAVASAESSFDPDAVCNNLHEIDAANNPLFYPNGKPRIAIIATYDGTMLPLNQIYNLSSGGRGRVIGHCRGLWQVNSLQHPTIRDSDTFTPSIAVRRAWGISRGGRFWGKWTSVVTGTAWEPTRLSAARAAARAIDPTVLQQNAPVGTRVRAWTTGGGVRATPGGTFHRGIRLGDTGTILAGPVIASITQGPLTSQHLWYQVQWDHGTTGWCVEEYLTQTTLPVQNASPAYNPIPADGQVRMPVAGVTLDWAIGGNTKELRLRFGTDPALTAANTLKLNGGLPTQWPTGPLETYRNYYWRVDSVSNNGSVVQGPTWTFRTVPPVAQPVTLSNITVTPRPAGRGQTITISGTASSPGQQAVLLGASVGSYSDPARDVAFTVPGGNVPTQFSRSFVLPADIPFGTYAVTVGAWQDLDGSGTIEAGDVRITEASAANGAVVADVTLPSLTNLSASSPTNLPNQLVQLSATASDSGGSGLVGVYFYRAVSETTPSLGSWQVVAYRPATGNGPITLTAQDNPTVEGRYWYEMEAIDGAGNRRRVSAGTFRIQIPDLAPPVAKWLNPENGATVGGGGISVTGQATDDRTVASVYYRINGGAWTQVFQNFNNWSVFVNLEPGSNLIEMRAFDQAGKVSLIEPLYLYNPGGSFDSTIFDDLINFDGDQVNQRWQLESQGPSFDNGIVSGRLQSNSGNSALIRSNKTVPANTRAVEMRFAAEGEAGIYWRDNAFRNWRIVFQQNQNRLEIGHETSLQYLAVPAGGGGPLAKVRSLWRDGGIEIEVSRQGSTLAHTISFPQLRLANLSGQMEARTQSNFNSSVMDDIQLRALRPWDLFAIDSHSLKAGQSSKVRWPSFAGRSYTVETSATLNNPLWSSAGQVFSNGTVTEHTFTLPSGSKRFVRVRELP